MMDELGVLLIAMPWQLPQLPSIQLGILQKLLERTGVRTAVSSFHLAFMDHCLRESAGRAPQRKVRLSDYEAVAVDHSPYLLGDWIFTVPPFRDTPHQEADYVTYLRTMGVPQASIRKALAMRALVPAFLQECADKVVAARTQVVGFTTTFNQTVPSLVLAKILKRRDPSLTIVFGGANCDGPMGAALHRAFPWVDVVVRGEAEGVLPGVVKDLLSGGPVRPQPGLCYRDAAGRSVAVPQGDGGTLPMDEIPTPVYDEYFARLAQTRFAAEVEGDVRLAYETARGCWWGAKSHCTFCGLNGTSMAFRSKSPDRVVHEITALAARYGRLDFHVVDNILDLRYLQDVFPRLRDAGYDLNLFFETKANLTRAQVRLLRDAGVRWIQPGLESLSTPILKLMRKGLTAFQNIRFLKWCAEYGIDVSWSVIYGFPGEPSEEYLRMADLVPSLTHLGWPYIGYLALERFSPYHERPQHWGLELLGPFPYYRFIYPTDEAVLGDLTYTFDYRHADGRHSETYVGPLRRAVTAWQGAGEQGYRSLRYRRGPGFIVVRDRRPGLEAADYTFEDAEARIYLACEDGATPAEARGTLGPEGAADLSVDDVREFLDELVTLRLAYEEGGRYLSLALPARLPEQA
jgi:ribosomal peptide maturation radical SAM protein 1